jgi:hypothetical protein
MFAASFAGSIRSSAPSEFTKEMKQYRLQLHWPYNDGRFIINEDEWVHVYHPIVATERTNRDSGIVATYPEFDLLWLYWSDEKTDRFNSVEDFSKEFSTLSPWGATRYVACELPDLSDEGTYRTELQLFDCRTGQRMFQVNGDYLEPAPGRFSEVERLVRGIVPMMSGEEFRIT